MTRLALVDPTTLLGREIAVEIERAQFHWEEPLLFHTDDDDEHQVVQVEGRAALVPPLNDIEDLEDRAVIILASDKQTERHEIIDRVLESRPDVLFLDATGWDRYRHLTEPAMDADGLASGNRLHLAHPAIVMAATVLEAVRTAEPEFVSLFAIDPVSVFGKRAVATLARQAGARLQGGKVEESVGGGVLAFNIESLSGERLTEEASILLPGIGVAATEAKAGMFHGHLAQIGIVFKEPVEFDDINDRLTQDPRITVVQPPLNLDAIADRNDILITDPSISHDRRNLALAAIADGTRVGGALTAASILRGLT